MNANQRCFPHIVNLACDAVLQAVTKLKYAAENAKDFVPNDEDPVPTTFKEALKRDPVATTHSLIGGVGFIYQSEGFSTQHA